MTLYTVGHGTRSTEELIAVLRSAGIQRVADVRGPHPLHPEVRAGGDGWPVYDGGQERLPGGPAHTDERH